MPYSLEVTNTALPATPISGASTPRANSFRGNVEGGDPRCSFHWFGNSGRLYVFEAPIDLLAFLTLYPEAGRNTAMWPSAALRSRPCSGCWRKDPRIQRVVLCLDHDAAGIEATGRLTDILREHGHAGLCTAARI